MTDTAAPPVVGGDQPEPAEWEQALQRGIAGRTASSLSRWADWLVMAATLTQLRARLILPTSAPEAQAAIREADELRRQLLSRQHIQAVR